MSATEEDTELRDLLIQNLEVSGVLNKLKAEMRAAVFLAMEDQDRLENRTPLVNEDLKKCLNTRDGRLVASLITDFLQVFNLDFSLAVFQPEINSLNGLDSRDLVCKELALSDSEQNRKSPLLLELVRRGRPGGQLAQELSQKQISEARKRFDFYDKDQSGSVDKEDVKNVFRDLIPGMNRNMLEVFVSEELGAADRSSDEVHFQSFLGVYKRLFSQCRSVVVQDSDLSQQQQRPEDKRSPAPVSKIPIFKGQRSQTAAKDSDRGIAPRKADLHPPSSSSVVRPARLDLEVEDDPDEGDSFFDDPLPQPQKTYGWKLETSGTRGSPAASLSETSRPGGGGAGGGSSISELSHGRNGASNSRDKGPKNPSDRTGSLHLDEDVEYDDDFNSHRSDLSKSELSIGEEIEEVSIEGPDDSEKLDETTQDLSVSQLSHSHSADYMEDVA